MSIRTQAVISLFFAISVLAVSTVMFLQPAPAKQEAAACCFPPPPPDNDGR